MHDRYEPPTRLWPASPPAYPEPGAGGLFADPDWDPFYPALGGGTADEARDLGLRRLSMLTLHATGLSVVAAIGFTTVFASTAHHPQAGTVVAAKPTPGPATASGTPSPGPTPTHHKKKHHHQAAPAAAPAASSASSPAAAPAPSPPSLAPPATAPAPAPPSQAPPPVTSSGSAP